MGPPHPLRVKQPRERGPGPRIPPQPNPGPHQPGAALLTEHGPADPGAAGAQLPPVAGRGRETPETSRGEVVVGAVSPPERCSRSERSPDAELPGRCPKFYPAPPGVEPGGGRDRAGTGLAPATAPATATAPGPAVPAPVPAGGLGPCPPVSVLFQGSQPSFRILLPGSRLAVL